MKHKTAALLLFAFATGAVHAQVTLSRFPPNPGVLPGGGWQFTAGTTFANPPPARAWVNGVYGGVPKFVATDTLAIAGRAGALPVAVASKVGMGEGVAAVGRCLLGGGPLICGVGTAAAIAYAAYRMNNPDQVPGSNVGPGLIDADPGQPSTLATKFSTGTAGSQDPYATGWQASATAACALSAAQACSVNQCGEPNHPAGSSHTVTNNNTTCNVFLDGSPYYNRSIISEQQPSCGASIDASNPAYSIPAGGAPSLFDGKCPTARYNHQGITPEIAADRILAAPPTFPSAQWRDALGDAIDRGGQSVPSSITSSGPASQTGTPSSTSTTSGTTTTTTNNTPTYVYNYDGDKITYNTTNTTTTTTNDTSTTVGPVTTTTTINNAPATTQDPTDPCTANPGRVGCMALGEAGDLTSPPNTDVETSIGSTTFLSSSGCPAPFPLTFSISGLTKSYTISNTPLCDLMETLRPIFLALFAASAAFVFYDGVGRAVG